MSQPTEPLITTHPVVLLPADVDVLDFTVPEHRRPPRRSAFSIGRYDEDRRGLYEHELFGGQRTVHMGLDIGGPAGTTLYAPRAGRVLHRGYNPEDGDYGYVLVTEHHLRGRPIWALWGHLSADSIARWEPGSAFAAGDVLGAMGTVSENGGWPPHVHIQLAVERPETHDLPGVVRPDQREEARRKYPDPRLLIGPVYR